VHARRPGPYRNGQCTATFIYRPPAPPPAFQVARSTKSVTATDVSAASVTDPRDGTATVIDD
jgi:hypothetical protein